MSDGSRDASHTTDPGVPRLTILIPCWNAAETVERSLASVLAEDSVPFECIVIDDGSTDGTADVVQAVADRDPRVVVLRLPANVGVSSARNHGLAAVRSEWVAFHDADDLMRPGWLTALMGPTQDPDVRAVIGQRIWSDGERTWLGARYDNPDIREPGRKSIATHPGLLYFAACTGKVFHRSLLDGLEFEGRMVGDQAWTIRALLRAGGDIEVIDQTIFEWLRPHPDHPVATITTRARGSATGAAEMARVARTVFLAVSAEIDLRIDDPRTREAVKRAYFDRLIRSDLSRPLKDVVERRDPEVHQLFDALGAFFEIVPRSVLAAATDDLPTRLLRPAAMHWSTLRSSARRSYWRMVRPTVRADPRMPRRIAWRRMFQPPFVLARLRPPIGPMAASASMSFATIASRVLDRVGGR